jgi:hypothetical protein
MLYTKNVINELCFLLVNYTTCFDIWFGRYGFSKSGFSSGQILDRLGIQVLGQVFGPQEGENCWGLNTKSGGNKLRFPTPTQTHIFDGRSSSYGYLSTAHVQSSAGC